MLRWDEGEHLFEMEWTPGATRLRRIADIVPEPWIDACAAVARDLPHRWFDGSLVRIEWDVMAGAFELPDNCISIGITAETDDRSDGYIWCDDSHVDDSVSTATVFVIELTQDALERANFRWPWGGSGKMSAGVRDGRAVWLDRPASGIAVPVGELGPITS